MRTTTIGLAERQPRRSHAADPAGHRRGDLFAGLAAAVIVGQILFAQVTLLAVIILVAVGRVSRWRPHWLAVSALASLIWLVAAGPARAAAAYADGSLQIPQEKLLDDIRVLTRSGKLESGADAYLYVARQIWWAWPFYAIFRLPGFNGLLWWGYRWFNRNRYRVSRYCPLP